MKTKTQSSEVIIGIDPGKDTGFAWGVKGHESLKEVCSMPIHRAMLKITAMNAKYSVTVYVEDARKRKYFGDNSRAKQQGAGSVKRDCTIWEDFLTDKGIPFQMIHPIRGGTKWKADRFNKATKYKGQTNQNARDAGMIAFTKIQ